MKLRRAQWLRPANIFALGLLATGLIALAAFCGAQDADGDVATLRLQAPSAIGCFEAGQVEIWLDQLPARHPGDAISGRQDPPELVGFQFDLRYDPNVLAVGSPSDFVLNKALNDLNGPGNEDWGKVSTDIDAAAGSATPALSITAPLRKMV